MNQGLTFIAATTTLNSADVIEMFLQHMRLIGAAGVLVMDLGSSDGTPEVIALPRWQGFASLVPSKGYAADDSSNHLLAHAKARFGGAWCLFCDPDEFIEPGIATLTPRDEVSCISFARHNVTARREAVGAPGDIAWAALRLEIVKPAARPRADHKKANLSPPWIFGAVKPKILVRIAATEAIGSGDHVAVLNSGLAVKNTELAIRHYPMRSFAAFETKVKTAGSYLAQNPQFDENWGWHWRRWLRILKDGGLQAEFLDQFPQSAEAQRLLAEGTLREIGALVAR